MSDPVQQFLVLIGAFALILTAIIIASVLPARRRRGKDKNKQSER